MKVVIPFHAGDAAMTLDLLEWCQVLDGTIPQTCVLVPDPSVQWITALDILSVAERTFSKATMLAPPGSCSGGWPSAANQMFLFTAEQMSKGDEPWLWLEPDAIPLRPKWSVLIEEAYRSSGKPYLGAVIQGELNGHATTYMNGVAVYPANAYHALGRTIGENTTAFDVACASIILPMSVNSSLIHCHWGKFGKPPVFSRSPVPGMENSLTLSSIRPSAVLFHRNKDGSLLDLLQEQKAGTNGSHILVVLPFCNKDAWLALKNVQWMREMGCKTPNHAILCYPKDTSNNAVMTIEGVARSVFSTVSRFICGGTSTHTWPVGPNYAFQATARHVQSLGLPWLWLEADAVPLHQNWLQRLEREYIRHGKGFFGPIVANRGHMNGVAIYPANMATRCPRAMGASTIAWDYVLGGELGTDVHDASAIIQHCWGIVSGQPHSCDGPPAHFGSSVDVERWLYSSAVLFHRCKDGSLIDRLRERQKQ